MKLWPFGSNPRIHTYERGPSGIRAVDFDSLPRQGQSAVAPAPGGPQTDELRQRLQQLQPGKPAGPPIGRDTVVNPESILMGYDPQDRVSLGYIEQMARIGQVEGFQLVASARPEELAAGRRKADRQLRDGIQWLANPGGHDSWVEDHGEFTSSGEAIVPARLAPDSDDIEDWVIRGRRNRYQQRAEEGKPRPRADFALQGLVNRRQSQEEVVATALALGMKGIHSAKSYVEGGNMLAGQRPDGTPYALVGEDSLEVTRRLLSKDATPAQARQQVAHDYALPAEHVIAVEQPGDFHIDMAMSLAGPGQVILNDARKVLELQRGWLKEHYEHKWFGKEELPEQLEAVEKKAERQAVYEDLVAEQLQDAGLEVFRVAGCFPKSAANPEMNFLNLRQGTNEQGQVFAVALGGEPRAEKAFAESLLGEIPSSYQRIHFLDRRLTEESLKFKGGIKCRSKILA